MDHFHCQSRSDRSLKSGQYSQRSVAALSHGEMKLTPVQRVYPVTPTVAAALPGGGELTPHVPNARLGNATPPRLQQKMSPLHLSSQEVTSSKTSRALFGDASNAMRAVAAEATATLVEVTSRNQDAACTV